MTTSSITSSEKNQNNQLTTTKDRTASDSNSEKKVTADDLIALQSLISRWEEAGESRETIYDICETQPLQWFLAMPKGTLIRTNKQASTRSHSYEKVDFSYINAVIFHPNTLVPIDTLRTRSSSPLKLSINRALGQETVFTVSLVRPTDFCIDDIFVLKRLVGEVEERLNIQCGDELAIACEDSKKSRATLLDGENHKIAEVDNQSVNHVNKTNGMASTTASNNPYLDKNNQNYSTELYLAIEVWQHAFISKKWQPQKKGFTTFVIGYLDKNTQGLSVTAKNRIAQIANPNWNKNRKK